MILVVGNYCHDTLEREDGSMFQGLGGSSAYISRVLAACGAPFRVIAKVGRDFNHSGEIPPGVLVTPGLTTHFHNEYRGTQRLGRLTAVCEPISSVDIRAAAPEGRVAVALACGVAFEIRPETLAELRGRAGLVLCDAQGLIREQGPGGWVTHVPFDETPFAESLGAIDILKMSRTEAEFFTLDKIVGQTRVIVTDGARGATLYAEGRELRVPAVAAREVDPTGAGDSFFAGLALGLWQGRPVEAAMELGALWGARAVEQLGVPRFSDGGGT